QPTFDPQRVWRAGGAAVGAGIDGETIAIHEDAEGREVYRRVHEGELPPVGSELGRSRVDGRPWLVHALERDGGRVALHLRKGGDRDRSGFVQHPLTVPHHVR
ncbi:MAG TPA: hypothetical protein VG079_03035, partial [Gaiellaceae bacterium]|nr:hypothetical protein [Gaiellaceae bacterium]